MTVSYTQVTVTGYNSSPPSDDGTVSASNQVFWSTIKTKLADPLKTALDSIDDNVAAAIALAETDINACETRLTTAESNISSLQTATTAANLLTAIKTVDGSGSGLDADTLDGTSSGGFCQTANNLSDVGNASTAFGNIKQAATTSASGAVELATAAEMVTGTDTGRVPSVSVVKNSPNAAKAWGTVTNAGALTGLSHNAASASNDSGTGNFSVTFTDNMSTGTYVVILTVEEDGGFAYITSRSASGFSYTVRNTSANLSDQQVSFVVFGTLA